MIGMNSLMKKKLIGISLSVCICLTGLFGCAEKQEETVVAIVPEDENVAYVMASTTRGDVMSTKNLTVTYKQTKDQEVCFDVGGKRIEKVHVHEGDKVKPGDVLVELSQGTLIEDIARLEYEIDRLTLELSFLPEHEEFELADSYSQYVRNNSAETPKDDEYDDADAKRRRENRVKVWEERDEDIKDNYRYQREDLTDELEFDKQELTKLKSELGGSRLVAKMGGIIYKVEDNLEGSISKKDKVIMTIIDGNEGLFEMQEPDYAQYFNEGDVIKMNIAYGSAQGDYELTPYNYSSWGDKQYFSILDGPENEGIEVDTAATIQAVLGCRKDVLRVPKETIFKADGKTYVYVLDESNMRSVRWVETGMVGDEFVEILSGLSEGEQVVKK